MGDLVSIRSATIGPSKELAAEFKQVGINPDTRGSAIAPAGIVPNTFDLIRSFANDPVSVKRIKDIGNVLKFTFSLQSTTPDHPEHFGYRPQVSLEGSNAPEVMGVYISPSAIGRMTIPVASLARGNSLVPESDTTDIDDTRVIKVGVGSTAALALGYTIFCELGRFDTRAPCADYPDLDAIAEESGMTKDEGATSGYFLQAVALRFAGGVAMRYAATFMAELFSEEENESSKALDRNRFGQNLRSMALHAKLLNAHTPDHPVSFALEHAYSAEQMRRVTNLWFRVAT